MVRMELEHINLTLGLPVIFRKRHSWVGILQTIPGMHRAFLEECSDVEV